MKRWTRIDLEEVKYGLIVDDEYKCTYGNKKSLRRTDRLVFAEYQFDDLNRVYFAIFKVKSLNYTYVIRINYDGEIITYSTIPQSWWHFKGK
jgi:hypothetical protein